MRSLLHPRQAEVLSLLARSRSLLAFDFDGTLAPIVRNREKASLPASTRVLLAQVCQRYPTAIISGRSRGDVRARLAGVAAKYVVGNHGVERGRGFPAPRPDLDEARARLGRLVAMRRGLSLEDKRHSLTVHFRDAPDPGPAQAAIRRVVRSLALPTRIVAGKCVLNVMPAQAPHKGDALRWLRAQEGADLALYVGDDVTDEDVFRIAEPGRLISVRVGRSTRSAAGYFLRDQREIDGLLRRLVRLRE